MDAEVQKTFQRILKKQGMNFIMGAAVQSVDVMKTKAKVTYKSSGFGRTTARRRSTPTRFSSQRAASPSPTGWGLPDLGVEMTERGQVKTDAHWATNVKGIHAIGDCIAGPDGSAH